MSKRVIKYILFIFVLCCTKILTAQNLLDNHKFENISIDDGLSSSNVNWIIQDSKGFLWIGTEDGLNRYDGYIFKVYRNKRGDIHSLSNNFIWHLFEDSKGNIWVGTDAGGINRFDPITEKFERFVNDPSNSNSISPGAITYTTQDSYGNIWIGTWGGGISVFDPNRKSFTNFKHNNSDPGSLSSDKIFCIYEDNKKNIWVGTDNGGLNLYDKKSNSFKYSLVSLNIPFKNSINYITQLHNGNLLLGTTEGWIIEFNPETNKYKIYPIVSNSNEKVQNIIWNIEKDPEGFYWIATSQQGIYKFYPSNDDKFPLQKSFEKLTGVFEKNAKCVYMDKEDNLWIGSIGDGIVKINRKKKDFYQINKLTTAGAIKDNYTFSICEDNNGNLWIGTMSGGLYRYDLKTKTIKNYPPNSNPSGLSGEMMRYIFVDKLGTLWIAPLFGKLNRYNYKTDSFDQIDLDFSKDNPDAELIRVVYEDNDGVFWIGLSGAGGLIKYDRKNGTYKRYTTAYVDNYKVELNELLTIAEDKTNGLWIGTYSFGLFRFNKGNEQFIHYKREENNLSSLPDNTIPEVFFDSKDNMWIATYSGLCLYNSEEDNFTTYTKENGLPSNTVFSIVEDNNYNLWLGTSNGISKFDIKQNKFFNFDFTQGVQNGDFLAAARCKLKDGRIFFGGNNGITFFHPDSVLVKTKFKTPVLTSFKIFNKDVKLEKSITYSDTVIVDYFDNMFSFEFSSLEFNAPEKINYAYYLEGLDKNWIPLENNGTATFTHLSPGEYNLKVKSSDIFGNWSEEYLDLAVIVTPPFWMTWWFRGLFVLVFLSIGPIIYYKRVKQLKKEKQIQVDFSKQLIQSQEEERKRIASELHDSIGQDLLVIKNLALLNKNKDENFTEISNVAGNSIDEVRRISYNLHPYQLERLGLTKALSSMFTNIQNISDIKFETKIDNVDTLFEKNKEINIFRIIQECVNNIIKHSKATEANVRVEKTDNELSIEIADNGKGFDFENVRTTSKGFGLKNIENRVTLLNGDLKYSSNDILRTKINIIIPTK